MICSICLLSLITRIILKLYQPIQPPLYYIYTSIYSTPIYLYNLFTCAEDESEVNMEQKAFALDQYVIEMTITDPQNVPEKLNKRNEVLKMDYGSPHVRDKILYYD